MDCLGPSKFEAVPGAQSPSMGLVDLFSESGVSALVILLVLLIIIVLFFSAGYVLARLLI